MTQAPTRSQAKQEGFWQLHHLTLSQMHFTAVYHGADEHQGPGMPTLPSKHGKQLRTTGGAYQIVIRTMKDKIRVTEGTSSKDLVLKRQHSKASLGIFLEPVHASVLTPAATFRSSPSLSPSLNLLISKLPSSGRVKEPNECPLRPCPPLGLAVAPGPESNLSEREPAVCQKGLVVPSSPSLWVSQDTGRRWCAGPGGVKGDRRGGDCSHFTGHLTWAWSLGFTGEPMNLPEWFKPKGFCTCTCQWESIQFFTFSKGAHDPKSVWYN